MAHGIPLRSDFNGDDLRGLARASSDGKQTRRLLAPGFTDALHFRRAPRRDTI